MSRLLFLSTISAAIGAGCGDGNCGPMGALDVGLAASSDQVTLTYGHLAASANNDCPDPMAPPGVISLTINGVQTDGSGLMTLCVPRPDKLAKMALAFGSDVMIVDLSGDSATTGCSYTLDATRPATGTASGQGMCGNGTDKAGFAMVFQAALSLQRTCGTTVDSIAVTLRGTVAVKGP